MPSSSDSKNHQTQVSERFNRTFKKLLRDKLNQILNKTNKKTNLSLPSPSDEISLSSQFDQVLDQHRNEIDINTQRNVYSIIYVLNKLTKFGFLKLKHDIKIKPLAMVGICFIL